MIDIRCCRECTAPKRHFHCHAVCAEYAREKERGEVIRKKLIQDRKLEAYFRAQERRPGAGFTQG